MPGRDQDTALHFVVLIPSIELRYWVKNRLANLHKTGAYAHRTPIAQRSQRDAATIPIVHFLCCEIFRAVHCCLRLHWIRGADQKRRLESGVKQIARQNGLAILLVEKARGGNAYRITRPNKLGQPSNSCRKRTRFRVAANMVRR